MASRRLPDAGSTTPWYKFDDSKVSPFAESDIADEAFGGSGGDAAGYVELAPAPPRAFPQPMSLEAHCMSSPLCGRSPRHLLRSSAGSKTANDRTHNAFLLVYDRMDLEQVAAVIDQPVADSAAVDATGAPSSETSLALTGALARKIRLHVLARRAKARMTACIPSYLHKELAIGVGTCHL